MATLGQTVKPASTWVWYGLNEPNQVWNVAEYTMPEDGLVTGIVFFAAANSGTSYFRGVVWNSAGSVLIEGNQIAVGQGSESPGGQSWQTSGVGSVFLAAGTVIRIGWWRNNASNGMLYSLTGSGSSDLNGPVGSPSSQAGASSESGQIGAYITYTPGQPPTANTDPATAVGASSATLNGDSNPQGFATNVWFQYGTSTAYGSSTGQQGIGSGSTDTAFSAAISGLAASTTYHFRAVAQSTAGTTYGTDAVFTTGAAATAPSPPTLVSPGGGSPDVSQGLWFTMTYNSTDGSAQNAYVLQLVLNGTTWYWDAATQALTATETWNACDVAAGANWSVHIPASQIANGDSASWTAASQESVQNLQGAFATAVGFSPTAQNNYHGVQNGQAASPNDVNQFMALHPFDVAAVPTDWSAASAGADGNGGWNASAPTQLGSTPLVVPGPVQGSGQGILAALAIPLATAAILGGDLAQEFKFAADVLVEVVDSTTGATLASATIPAEVIQARWQCAAMSAPLSTIPPITAGAALPGSLSTLTEFGLAAGPNGLVVIAGGSSGGTAQSIVYVAQLSGPPAAGIGQWQQATSLPSPVAFPGLAYDPLSGTLFAVGGLNSSAVYAASFSGQGAIGAWQLQSSVPANGPLLAACDGLGNIYAAVQGGSSLWWAPIPSGQVGSWSAMPSPGRLTIQSLSVCNGYLVASGTVAGANWIKVAQLTASGPGPWVSLGQTDLPPYLCSDGSALYGYNFQGFAPAFWAAAVDEVGHVGPTVASGSSPQAANNPPVTSAVAYDLGNGYTAVLNLSSPLVSGAGLYVFQRWPVFVVPLVNIPLAGGDLWQVEISTPSADASHLTLTVSPAVFAYSLGPQTILELGSQMIVEDLGASWYWLNIDPASNKPATLVRVCDDLVSTMECSYGAISGALLSAGDPGSQPLLVPGN